MIESRKNTGPERAVVVGAYQGEDLVIADVLLDELASLVDAAGGEVVGRVIQKFTDSRGATPATFIGAGKAEFVAELAEANDATLVVFDNELSPAQVRSLEKIMKRRVIDRSELILDIFASRARTREAKLQVELAQLQYTAPRLRGMWTHLERQAQSGAAGGMGGIGTRGPGEKQIEIDRRIVADRLNRLRGELATIHRRRKRQVSTRSSKHFCVSLVGYTNAGKSTLLNALTSAETYSADQLFATLDTKTRRWSLPGHLEFMLSDTVGFVRDLPHQLVASFRSTLEEALEADLLLHVIDASHPQVFDQIQTVEIVLAELGCDLSRILAVLNKIDQVDDPDVLTSLRHRLPQVVEISAARREGLERLEEAVIDRYRQSCAQVQITAPYDSGKLQAFVRANCGIDHEEYDDEGWHVRLLIPEAMVARLQGLCPEARIERLDG
jgi:GTP-binding protein HflX